MPKREELPEEVVEKAAQAVFDFNTHGGVLWENLPEEVPDGFGLSRAATRRSVTRVLQAALDTGHLLLVPEGEVATTYTAEEAEFAEYVLNVVVPLDDSQNEVVRTLRQKLAEVRRVWENESNENGPATL